MTHFASPGRENPVSHTVIADDARLRSAAHPPVFLHCGWRTRGTWIWNRFRGSRNVTGYYEPLAEHLARLRPDTVDQITAATWASGHKELDRPYYDEFRPFLSALRPGVSGHRAGFATDDFFAAPENPLPDLECYLRALLDAARQRGVQPVLKFCRSLGRIGWMRRNFPEAVHILIIRDPFSQFMSSLGQYVRHDNGYFLAMPLLLLALNRDLPLITCSTRQLGVELPDLAWARDPMAACEAALRASTPAAWYRLFLSFWVAAAATFPDDMDLVIDTDALVNDSFYRLRRERDLARLTGLATDFADADASGAGARAPSPLRRSEVLAAHAGAEAVLTEQVGASWADGRVLGDVARKLAEARARALGAEPGGPAARSSPCFAAPDEVPNDEATLLSASVRAAWAERELAAVLASRSWRVTAPLRWLRQSV